MIADAKICKKCCEYAHQDFGERGICLHNLFSSKFVFNAEDNKIRILIDTAGKTKKTTDLLTKVPEKKCPFLLEQTVSPLNNVAKNKL